MKTILIETKDFFLSEKRYLFLFIFIVLFYGSIYFIGRHLMDSQALTSQGTQQEQVEEDEPLFLEDPKAVHERLNQRPRLYFAIKVFAAVFGLVFVIGVWLGAQDLKRLFLRQELIPVGGRAPNLTWGVAEMIRVILLFFIYAIIVNIGFAIVTIFFIPNMSGQTMILSQAFILDLSLVYLIIRAVHKQGSRVRDLIGFDFPKIATAEIWWGIRTYLVILPIFLMILLSLVFIAMLIQYQPEPHPLVKVLLKEETLTPLMIVASFVLACFVGPVVEEIFFRGFLFPALKKYWGMRWAMGATALLFAGVHENSFAFFPIFFLGIVLAYLYEKRRSLVACMVLHMVHNTAFIIYFFLLKDIVAI